MEEGEFSKGEKNGYCRVISAKTGTCQLGFYKSNEPHGKWTSYKPDGSLAEPEGLYEGQVVTQRLSIKTYNEKIIKTKE